MRPPKFKNILQVGQPGTPSLFPRYSLPSKLLLPISVAAFMVMGFLHLGFFSVTSFPGIPIFLFSFEKSSSSRFSTDLRKNKSGAEMMIQPGERKRKKINNGGIARKMVYLLTAIKTKRKKKGIIGWKEEGREDGGKHGSKSGAAAGLAREAKRLLKRMYGIKIIVPGGKEAEEGEGGEGKNERYDVGQILWDWVDGGVRLLPSLFPSLLPSFLPSFPPSFLENRQSVRPSRASSRVVVERREEWRRSGLISIPVTSPTR